MTESEPIARSAGVWTEDTAAYGTTADLSSPSIAAYQEMLEPEEE